MVKDYENISNERITIISLIIFHEPILVDNFHEYGGQIALHLRNVRIPIVNLLLAIAVLPTISMTISGMVLFVRISNIYPMFLMVIKAWHGLGVGYSPCYGGSLWSFVQ